MSNLALGITAPEQARLNLTQGSKAIIDKSPYIRDAHAQGRDHLRRWLKTQAREVSVHHVPKILKMKDFASSMASWR